MAITRTGTGTLLVNTTGTTQNVAWPTGNGAGDLAFLVVGSSTSSMTVTTPTGWTLLHSTISTPEVWVFYQTLSATQSGTVAVATTSGGFKSAIYTYSGTSGVPTIAGPTTGTTSTTATSGSMTFGDYAIMLVESNSSCTLSAEASSAGSWVPTEAVDNSGGPSPKWVDGPIASGTTATLSGTLSASVTYRVWTISLSAPVTSFSASPALSGAGALTTVATPSIAIAAALSGAGTLTSVGAPNPVVATALSGSGTLAGGTPVPAIANPVALSGSGSLAAATTVPAVGGLTGVVARYRADQVVGVSNGGAIASWPDISGNGYTATQSTGANQPTLNTTGMNGLPTVHFNGTSSAMLSSAPAGGATQTVIAIFTSPNPAQIQTLRGAGAVGDAGNSGLQFRLPTGTAGANRYVEILAENTANLGGSAASVVANAATVAAVTYDSGTGARLFYINGTQSGSGTSVRALTAHPTAIGYNPGVTSEWFSGDMAELLVYDHVLTPAEMAQVDTYAQDRYGMTVSDYLATSFSASPALTGSGTLTSVGAPSIAIAATPLSGSGTLTSAAIPNPKPSVALSGSGTITTTQVPKPAPNVALSGAGGLLAGAVPMASVAVPLAGSGTLSNTSVPTATGTVALSGAGTLTPGVGAPSPTVSVSLSGAGTLTGAVIENHPGSAALTGDGALTAGTSPSFSRPPALTGNGTLTGKLITTLKNDFDNGNLSNTVISTTTSGFLGEDAFDVVNIGANSSVTYTNGAALHAGAISAHLVYNDFETAYLQWNMSPVTATSRTVVRAYVMFGVATAGTTEQFVYVRNSAGQITQVGLNSTGRWIATAKSGVTIGTAPANVTPAINTWYRIEIAVTPGVDATSGTSEIAVYQGHSLTPDWSISSNTLDLGTTPVTAVRFGRSLTTANARQHWFDDVAANANYPTGFLGPSEWPVALTGAGSLSGGTPLPSVAAAIALSGSGTLAASGVSSSSATGTADFTGSGSLAGSAVIASSGTASLTGAGALSAAAVPTTSVTVPLSGAGSLFGAGTAKPVVTVNLAGSGSLAGSAVPAIANPVALSGSGTLAGNATGFSGFPTLTGSGSLAGSGVPTVVTTVTLTGSGSLAPAATPTLSGTAGLSGSGSLSGAGTPKAIVTVNLAGSGSLAGSATLASSGLAALAGSGSLQASAAGAGSASVNLSGSGSLAPVGKPVVAVQVALSGVGGLTFAALPTGLVLVALTGTGGLTTAGLFGVAKTVNLAGTGSLSSVFAPSGVAAFTGSGALLGSVVVIQDLIFQVLGVHTARLNPHITPPTVTGRSSGSPITGDTHTMLTGTLRGSPITSEVSP